MMWFKMIVALHGDIWLLALLPLSFLLLGISLGILYPTSVIDLPSSSKLSTVVPVWRQGWTPSNAPTPIKKLVFVPSNKTIGEAGGNGR